MYTKFGISTIDLVFGLGIIIFIAVVWAGTTGNLPDFGYINDGVKDLPGMEGVTRGIDVSSWMKR